MAETTQDPGSASVAGHPTLLTFLIVDVRGYTRFTAEQGDELAARLADRFAGLCEGILGAHQGQVIELRGDEALAVFSSARHALRGAVALQQAFRQSVLDDPSLPLYVGMGLDAGEPVAVRGGYRGGALNLAARLCSIAGLGEILASEGVVHMARKTEGLAFVDRGQVTLKGLSTPVRVLQIAPEGELPDDLPPLQPILVTHPTNLPDDATPFIGREQDIGEVVSLLQQPGVRCVTLTGPGGTGKTRLALQAGNTLLYAFDDGAFFCDLSSLSDPALIPSALADVLQVKEEPGVELLKTIADSLRGKHILLVLDNFEHLLSGANAVARLLDRCRQLSVLITSRIPLHISREHEYPVRPLAVPGPRDLPQDATRISQFEAVAFFIDRARAVIPGFQVTAENAVAVAEICVRLDGLPLAIELAAARIKLFPPAALLQRLGSRLKLLTGGARDRPSRQQTLRGTIDWSYSLLSPEEQTLFAHLSVFAGGWSCEAAEAVCDPEGAIEVVEGLASLVDKSLLRQEGEKEPRLSMLETLREYAAEKLRERGDEEQMRAAHARYYVRMAEDADPQLRGPMQLEWMTRLDTETANIRIAVDFMLREGDAEGVLRLVPAMYDYWIFRHQAHEAYRWLEGALDQAASDISPGIRGKALWALGALISWWWWGMPQAEVSALPYLEAALPLLREAGDRFVAGRTILCLGNLTREQGDDERATVWYEKGLELFRDLGNQRGIGVTLANLAMLAARKGDDALAIQRSEEAVALFRAAGDLNMATHELYMFGTLLVARGELDRADQLLTESLHLYQERGRPHHAALVLESLGVLALKRGQVVLARDRLHEALVTFRDSQETTYQVEVLGPIASLALASGEPERAGRLLGALFQLRTTLGVSMWTALQRDEESTVARVRASLGEDAWQRAQRAGGAMSLEEAVNCSLGETV